MAMVRMTVDITAHVVGKVRAIYEKQQKDHHATHGTDWGTRVYDKVLGRYAPLLQDVPKDFLVHQAELSLTSVLLSGGRLDVGLRFVLDPSRPMPVERTSVLMLPYAKTSSYYNTSWDLLPEPGDDEWTKLISEIETWAAGQSAIKVASSNAVTAARRVMENNSTIKGALEDWPALMDLLPAEVVERHKAPAEPRKKPQRTVVASPDMSKLDEVTAHLTMEKLIK